VALSYTFRIIGVKVIKNGFGTGLSTGAKSVYGDKIKGYDPESPAGNIPPLGHLLQVLNFHFKKVGMKTLLFHISCALIKRYFFVFYPAVVKKFI